MKIIPAIAPKDLQDFRNKLAVVEDLSASFNDTDIGKISPLVDLVDEVLFLGMDPREHGPFDVRVLQNITRWHSVHQGKMRPQISVDGGIERTHLNDIQEAPVDIVYVGSAFFEPPDPSANYKALRATVRKANE